MFSRDRLVGLALLVMGVAADPAEARNYDE